MNLRTALLQGQRLLEEGGVAVPRLTAEVLLGHAVGRDRVWLFAHDDEELREVWWIHYGRYLHQRLQGKPTQYITGRQEFYGREFRVNPSVLIPRPETELLVETALASPARRILDIGTGSGAIAVTLSLETAALVAASDISADALHTAKANGTRLGGNVEWVQCDLGSALAEGSFDLVVSNPPYVAESESATLAREVRDWEPGLALFAGDEGLDVYRRLLPEARRLLKPDGRLLLEAGAGNARQVAEMLGDWDEVRVLDDLAGLPRVVMARRR